MRVFYASMSYDVSPETTPEARKLLRAELVGRRWHDRVRNRLMPRMAVWIDKKAEDHQTTDDIHTLCARDLRDAARAVAATGRHIKITRAFIQVTGAGTFGLADEGFFD
jgi:hypothetical protein